MNRKREGRHVCKKGKKKWGKRHKECRNDRWAEVEEDKDGGVDEGGRGRGAREKRERVKGCKEGYISYMLKEAAATD